MCPQMDMQYLCGRKATAAARSAGGRLRGCFCAQMRAQRALATLTPANTFSMLMRQRKSRAAVAASFATSYVGCGSKISLCHGTQTRRKRSAAAAALTPANILSVSTRRRKSSAAAAAALAAEAALEAVLDEDDPDGEGSAYGGSAGSSKRSSRRQKSFEVDDVDDVDDDDELS